MEETKKLIEFLEKSTDCFHAVQSVTEMLTCNGFERLYENEKWDIKEGGRYFIIRNMSSIAAFCMPKRQPKSIMIAASHSDSPAFKIKPNPEMEADGYVRLNTEGYGGMIDSSWLDRPLSVSGRVAVKNKNGIEMKLINADRDLLLIPGLCIHMNRNANSGYEFNHQKDLIPILGSEKNSFIKIIADEAKVCADDITGYDLFLYNRTHGSIWGANNEYFSCGRIDDLQCVYSSIKSLTSSQNTDALQMAVVFDNEETGSSSKQGAKSDFLYGVLERIFEKYTKEDYRCAVANGFMLSADNAHAVHPNHVEKSDPTNRVYMNKGIVIKYNANQSYTTDSVSEAVFKMICDSVDVPYQTFTNRSDMRGGSTLGNLSNNRVSLNSVDIGLAQLAMHSSYETAGTKDTTYMVKAVTKFFDSDIRIEKDNNIIVRG